MGRIVCRFVVMLASLGALTLLSACLAGPQPEPPTDDPRARADASAGLGGDAGAFSASDAGRVMPPSADASTGTDDSAWDLDPSAAYAGAGERSGSVIRWGLPGPGSHLDLPDAGAAPDGDVDADPPE